MKTKEGKGGRDDSAYLEEGTDRGNKREEEAVEDEEE